MITIRRATPQDAAMVHGLMRALAEHQDEGWAVTVTVDRLAGYLGRPEVGYLVAERDGRPVGYVSWLRRVSLWAGRDYLALDDLYVADGERGHGVGERLMRAAAEEAGGLVIRWEVAQANVAAQRFYARIGATLTTKTICRLATADQLRSS
ncbi:GNAT family N-acetyltransferase [Nonomuraea sp. NPDC050328]|uniref:GNAT family N-acetyltransferase n=1 Tax=Nonomuraea sp. NPDC050328 TaxID=3364361 RepID=UPI00379392E4